MLAVGCREPASDTDFAMVPPQGCWLGDTRAGDKGPDSGVPRVLGPRPRDPVPSRVTSLRRLPEAPPDGPTVAGDVLRATRSASSSVMPDGARPAATATAACTARGSRPVLGAGVVAVRDVADRCRINAPSARDAPGPCRPRAQPHRKVAVGVVDVHHAMCVDTARPVWGTTASYCARATTASYGTTRTGATPPATSAHA